MGEYKGVDQQAAAVGEQVAAKEEVQVQLGQLPAGSHQLRSQRAALLLLPHLW